MIARFACLTVAAALLASAAQAQDTPIARNSVDAAPPITTITTAPAASKSAQSTQQSLASIQPAPQAAGGATSTRSGDPTADQIADWIHADAAPVQPLDPRDAPLSDFQGPRRMHGEVGFEVSNRGYGGYGAVSMPIGQASELDVAVAGAHERTPWGTANPKSLSVGLYLDGSDVARFISRDKCHVPRYGVRLPDDPQVQPDGSCVRTDKSDQGE